MKKMIAAVLLACSTLVCHAQTYNSARQELVSITGVTPTYAVSGSFTPPSGVLFAICGSSANPVVLRSLQIGGTATSASSIVLSIVKTSTAPSAGTAIPGVSFDTADPAATALAEYYTSAPTPGTPIGTLSTFTIGLPPPTGITGLQIPSLIQNPQGQKPIILRGTSQCVELLTASSIPGGTSLQVSIGWTEEMYFPPYPASGR